MFSNQKNVDMTLGYNHFIHIQLWWASYSFHSWNTPTPDPAPPKPWANDGQLRTNVFETERREVRARMCRWPKHDFKNFEHGASFLETKMGLWWAPPWRNDWRRCDHHLFILLWPLNHVWMLTFIVDKRLAGTILACETVIRCDIWYKTIIIRNDW